MRLEELARSLGAHEFSLQKKKFSLQKKIATRGWTPPSPSIAGPQEHASIRDQSCRACRSASFPQTNLQPLRTSSAETSMRSRGAKAGADVLHW